MLRHAATERIASAFWTQDCTSGRTDIQSVHRGVLHYGRSRSIRPPAGGNHEHVDWFRSATELWIPHDGRLGQICTPDSTVHKRSVKHQVIHPRSTAHTKPFLPLTAVSYPTVHHYLLRWLNLTAVAIQRDRSQVSR